MLLYFNKHFKLQIRYILITFFILVFLLRL